MNKYSKAKTEIDEQKTENIGIQIITQIDGAKQGSN